MRLDERLTQLKGRRVKIGGSNGFIYCGEVFDELPFLLDEIASEEREKMRGRLTKAQRIYNEREGRWSARKEAVANDIAVYKANLDGLTAKKERLTMFMQKAEGFLHKYRRSTKKAEKATKLIRIKNHLKKAIDENALAWSKASKALKYRQTLHKTMQTEDAKKRQFAAWKRNVDNLKSSIATLKKLSEIEITEEYGSQMERGERIIIVNVAIEGPYWYDEEMERDMKMSARIERAKRHKATLKCEFDFDI